MSPAKQKLLERIESDFKYHAPQPGQPALYEELRNEAKALARRFIMGAPEGRELATALTKLEEAVMWVNAGIARGTAASAPREELGHP